ncbi:MAG: methyltransferase [Planctomycetes bacterium]|nr:methyltransferase [Planctomycetota bacterium]
MAHRLSLEDAGGIQILGNLFRSAGYRDSIIREALRAETAKFIPSSDVPLMLRRLPQDGLLPTLIRLFFLGRPVEADRLTRNLEPLSIERLESMGVIRSGPGGIEPRVRFLPFGDLVLACDPYFDDPRRVPSDYVLGVNATSLSLAALTVRRQVKSILDVGTGCGVQALLAAGHGERVVATDLNARAINFTAFNARLNQISNVEGRPGSLFQPVEGRTFDLIVSNPPYVISPDNEFQFRDSGRAADTLCAELLRGIPERLNEGGFATVLCNWVVGRDEPWSAAPGRWVAGLGCDALLLHSITESPLEYAGAWNRPFLPLHPAAYEAAMDRWMEYYRRADISAIASGAVLLRRRTASRNWSRAESLAPLADANSSDHILRIFEAQDRLLELDDARLLETAFRVVEDIRIDQVLTVRDGQFGAREIRLSLIRGLKFSEEIDPLALRVLRLCDGRHRLQEAVEAASRDYGMTGDELLPKILPLMKRLYAIGFLVY